MKLRNILFILTAFLILSSCSKEEGRGGKASIYGKIFIEDYNQEGILKDSFYPGEYPVYIIYGDDEFYGNDVKTHMDGSYLFDYLYPGEYTIFAYSKCKTCPGGREAITKEITIGSKDEAELEDLVLRD